jgi:hypothetical protein
MILEIAGLGMPKFTFGYIPVTIGSFTRITKGRPYSLIADCGMSDELDDTIQICIDGKDIGTPLDQNQTGN